jgi:hypothetical protein
MCFKYFNKKIKKFNSIDIGLIKLCVLFASLFLAKMFPVILGFDWYIYIILFVLCAIVPVMKLFKK